MKVTIFWIWYVWLVTWVCLAEVWHDVMCIDIDKNKINLLNKWEVPIYELWLKDLLERNFKEKRISFSDNIEKWITFWEVIFSAVWTPSNKNNWADLGFVKSVARSFWKNIDKYKVFVNKSTVPVWTWDTCKKIIEYELKIRKEKIWFDIVSNPEFLREWTAIKDFMLPDRIIIWSDSERAKRVMEKIYNPFKRNYINILHTDIRSSEVIKYASNAFLATKISFINEIANFAEKVWANINDISKWIWSDKRIWSRFLHAWIGYWWSCFPKDIKALLETWKDYGINFNIINSVEKVNNLQKERVIEKLVNLKPILLWEIITIWGLSFKPKTDDIRDSPSIYVINRLLELWVEEIKVFDPVAMNNLKKEFNNKRITFMDNNYDALINSSALLILTEWDEFRSPDFEKISSCMKERIIIDWRNIWSREEVLNLWFEYKSIWV